VLEPVRLTSRRPGQTHVDAALDAVLHGDSARAPTTVFLVTPQPIPPTLISAMG
jgi:hypothetical protein